MNKMINLVLWCKFYRILLEYGKNKLFYKLFINIIGDKTIKIK